MIKHVCTACNVKLYSFRSDARGCPVCQAPMIVVVTSHPNRETVKAIRSVVDTRRPGVVG